MVRMASSKLAAAGVSNVNKMTLAGEDEFTFSQLKSVEKRRRAILKRSELPFFKVLTFWDGTCLRLLCFDPLLWFTIIIYVVIRVQARIGLPEYVADLNTGNIGVIGSFLSFFLVYFVVTSNKRFDDQYAMSMAAKGRVLDVASMARASLPRDIALRVVRYMNASHVVGYVGLSDTYSYANFFHEINNSACLLTGTELQRINRLNMDAGGSCYRELVAWCQIEIQEAFKNELIDGRLASQYRDKLLAFQGALSSIYNYADQPIPFFYVHFISLLSALYLPLFAVSSAFEAGTGNDAYWTADLVAGLIVFLQSVFVIGLRLLGQKLSDPFGADLEDLSVMHYVNFTWQQSNRILETKLPQRSASQSDAQTEEDICRERATIGAAWEDENTAESHVGSDFMSESLFPNASPDAFLDESAATEPEAEGGWSSCVLQ